MIFVEGTIKESDMDRAPFQSETHYAENYLEEKGDEEANDK